MTSGRLRAKLTWTLAAGRNRKRLTYRCDGRGRSRRPGARSRQLPHSHRPGRRKRGVPVLDVRRVPGLRREEVALLAGITADYYLCLERGRNRRPSLQVLESPARVLRLDDDTKGYLLDLTCVKPRRDSARARRSFHPAPKILSRCSRFPPSSRALPRRPCRQPTGRGSLPAPSRDVGDPRFFELVGELSIANPLFRQRWGRHDVRLRAARWCPSTTPGGRPSLEPRETAHQRNGGHDARRLPPRSGYGRRQQVGSPWLRHTDGHGASESRRPAGTPRAAPKLAAEEPDKMTGQSVLVRRRQSHIADDRNGNLRR